MEKENAIGFNYSINDTSTNPLEPILKNKNEF
jgi:hypothetical protein